MLAPDLAPPPSHARIWPRVGILAVTLALGAVVLLGPLPLGTSAAASAPTLDASYTTNGISPPTTSYAATAYDAADGYALLFGGLNVNDNPTSYTWVFARGNWTNLTGIVGSSPPAMFGAGAAYDPNLGEVVLFGGCLDLACTLVTNATWAYAHDRWINVTHQAGAPPSGRGRTMMAYDPGLSSLVLYGGVSGGYASAGVYFDDTWLYNGTWHPFANSSSPAPPARAGAGFAYDAHAQTTVLFGGDAGPTRRADTWVFAHGTWANVTATAGTAPPARWGLGMTYDSEDGYVLLVDGCNNGNFLGDEWTFSGSSWAPLAATNPPPATCGSALVDDPGDGYVLFFSGDVSGGQLTSTLVFVHGTWTLLINPPGTGFSILPVLLTFGLVAALVLLAGWVGRRSTRRRQAALSEAVQLRPGDPVTWIDTPPSARRGTRLRSLPALIMAGIFVPIMFFVGYQLSLLAGLVFAALFVVILPAIFLAGANTLPRAIGIAPQGVIARRKSDELRAPWAQLQPGPFPPVRGLIWFQVYYLGQKRGMTGFATSPEQARAIVQSPYAPAWVLAPPLATALGLPTHRAPASQTPPPPAPPPTSPALLAGPLPPFGLTGGDPPSPPSAPPAPPPTWGTPLPSSSPAMSPYAAQPPPPPRGPPTGTVACPRCGQLNPRSGVMFCHSCGQRLRS